MEKGTMKIFRMAALAAALTVSAASLAAAQGGGGGGQRGAGMGQGRGAMMSPDTMFVQMFKGIEVDADTKKKALEILTKHQAAQQQMLQSAMGGGGGDMQAMRAQITDMTTKRNSDLKKLLSEADSKTFDANLAAMPGPGRRGGGGR
jgi:hypothetical protein